MPAKDIHMSSVKETSVTHNAVLRCHGEQGDECDESKVKIDDDGNITAPNEATINIATKAKLPVFDGDVAIFDGVEGTSLRVTGTGGLVATTGTGELHAARLVLDTVNDPIAVSSSIKCSLLNVDLVDGKHSTDFLLLDGTQTMTGDLDMGSNDITTTGLVDSRDVSVDGVKLDGIEASADVTDATSVAAAGAVMATTIDAKGDDLLGTANDTIARLATGADGRVRVAASGETTGHQYQPRWEYEWDVYAMKPTSTNGALFSTLSSGGADRDAFKFDGATNTNVQFIGRMPEFYSGNGLTFDIEWTSSDTANDFDWDIKLERIGGAINLTNDSFGGINSINGETVVVANNPTTSTITFTSGLDMDLLVAGEPFRVQLTRDAATDTSTSDAYVYFVRMKETQ
jgi:hypothetical protein